MTRAAPEIGVAAVILEAGQVLLIERGQPPAEGQWSIPGGRMKAGETLSEACRREVFEETGLEIATQSLLAVVERREQGFHYIIHDFLACLRPGSARQPQAGSDARQACWVPVDDLSHYPLVPGLAAIIQHANQGGTGLSAHRESHGDFW